MIQWTGKRARRLLLVAVGAAGSLLSAGWPAGRAVAADPVAAAPAAPLPAGAPDPNAGPAAKPGHEPTPEQAKFFEQKVRPLLVENCFSCHAEKKQKGRLRLDSIEAAVKGGSTGPAVVPGNPAKSLLVTAVGYHDADLQMPPEEKLGDAQVKLLTDWVAMGAPWPKTAGGAVAAVAGGKKRIIKDEDRRFWSFQPVKAVTPPAVPADAPAGWAKDAWAKNPIDAFVLAKLSAEKLTPAPEADEVTLIRRATFDLHGLPPTPAEVAAFVADPSSDAYEKLVDRLLASPRYGERYARHWLDLVRYADSDGFRQDAYRPNAWMYRDWVIGAFNADLPYDRFVTLQLAGDEVAPDSPDARVATGYLRHGMYEYNQKNAELQRSEYLYDVTDVTADALVGLSMGCARCHDHKFDPILQTDYFRLQAFFTPVQPRNDLPAATAADVSKFRAASAKWEAETAKLRAQIAEIEAPARAAIEVAMFGRFPPEVQAMIAKPPAERSPYEKQIAYLVYRQVDEDLKKLDDKIKGPAKEKLVALRIELSKYDDAKPKAPETALCATDVGPVAPPTRIPGDAQKRELDPGYPVVMDGLPLPAPAATPTEASTGRRTALAKWVTDPANPLTTRVIANRLWQWHFGRGLVKTTSDYGKLGEPPSHPELLDFLTKQFVDGPGGEGPGHGWGMKAMHRLIMTSATYRQSAVRDVPEVAKLKDPENRWLWRQNARRLEAEQIRDAMLAVAGELRPEQAGGPALDYTAPVRSVYTKQVRNTRDPLLDVFDQAEAFGSVADRNTTTTATQSLMMVNGDWPLKRATAFAQRLTREASSGDPGSIVDQAYQLAYGRAPRPDERATAVAFLNATRGTVPAGGTTPAPALVVAKGKPTAAPRDPANGPVAEASASASASDPSASPASPSPNVDDQPVTQMMPQTGGQAVLVRNALASDILRLPGTQANLVGDTFTVEGFVLLESLYESASVRVIASQWNGNQTRPGWSLGVTSERSAHQPRNLILQLCGTAREGAAGSAARTGGYEVVASNLRLELHKVYYVGVAVDLTDTSPAGVTFWLKDVGDMDAPLRTAQVRHNVTGPVASASPLTIGGREAGTDGKPAHGWDGLIGEIRVSNAVLKPEQNRWNEGDPKGAVVGHWTFEETPGLLKDSAGRHPDLVRAATAGSAKPGKVAAAKGPTAGGAAAKALSTIRVDAALIDLCHVLLNSSEFLYVD
jgi:hypothetical protein